MNAQTSTANGSTVLSWAVETDDSALLEFLISKGAEVDGRSRAGVTPLMIAVVHYYLKSVECLYDMGPIRI